MATAGFGRLVCRAVVAAFVALPTSGCSKSDDAARVDAEPTIANATVVAPATVAVVTQQVIDDLNLTPGAITEALQQASASGDHVDTHTLSLMMEDTTQPVDWWFFKRALIVLNSLDDYGSADIQLTAAGQNVVATPGPWFSAAPGAPQNVDCHAGASISAADCAFDITYSSTLLPAGQAALGPVEIAPFKVHAEVTREGGDWRIVNLNADTAPRALVLAAVFGPPEDREQRRQQELQAQVQRVRGAQAADNNSAGE